MDAMDAMGAMGAWMCIPVYNIAVRLPDSCVEASTWEPTADHYCRTAAVLLHHCIALYNLYCYAIYI